jgi:enoyl-CoA hydratase/carnithine racemase
MMLLGDPIDAEEARAIGLVSDLCDDAAVLDRALALAGRIARLPSLAVRQTKSLVLDSMNVPLDAGLRLEARAFQLTFATPEKTERMRAFLERRAASPPDGRRG